MKSNIPLLEDSSSRKFPIIFYSLIVGILSGFIILSYRLILGYVEKLSLLIYQTLKSNLILIPFWFISLIFLGYIVGKAISKNQMISGSGIPQVKAILMGYIKNNWLSTLILKFCGGIISILAGLSVGREGPSIQLGACIGEGVSKRVNSSPLEKKILTAGGCSAGLAAAFNAPIAGVLFVLEELFKYFSPLILLATMISAIVADFIVKYFLGIKPVFDFNISSSLPLSYYWLIVLLGVILGILGVIYNKTLLGLQKYYKSKKSLTTEKKVILTFILAGFVGLSFPILLGGGHHIIESLSVSNTIGLLILLLLGKFTFSIISFNSGVPGGIFFPVLVIGALIGALFAKISINYLGLNEIYFYNFIVFAMAGYLTAIVRAPITGIVLITEMTGSFQHLLPLTITSIIAYIVADTLKTLPIYDSLLENLLQSKNLDKPKSSSSKKVIIETIVQLESSIANSTVSEIIWPSSSLLVSIKRRELNIVPNGQTIIEAGDEILLITDIENEASAREYLNALTTEVNIC